VEVTSSAESSSAIFWCGASIVNTVFVTVMDALRAPVTANPPQNMKRGLIFLGVVVASFLFLALKQSRFGGRLIKIKRMNKKHAQPRTQSEQTPQYLARQRL